MSGNRIVQLVAAVILIASLGLSGALLNPILETSEENTLRYTDVAVENAPPIVAIGTSIGALRGVVVDVLWLRTIIMKEKGLFYEAMTDAKLITKLQPRFAAVWGFLGHNLAYNISVATNTEEERWEWVKQGIDLVRNEGLRYNPNDLVLHKELAFWLAHKIGGVADDANLFYKKEFCREWHRVLGAPPFDHADRLAWIKKVADAPETLEEAYGRTPELRSLVEQIRVVFEPHERLLRFDFNRDFLFAYSNWRAVKTARFSKILNREAELRRFAEAGSEQGRVFVAFDALADDPQYAQAWDTLLAYTRKKVLRSDYNMDPQLMYKFTEETGPIDWRHESAHSLYWARRGSQLAEKRSWNEDQIYKIVNNDRLQIQAMQDLARSSLINFDPLSDDVPSRLPDSRWYPVFERLFEHFYQKHQNTRGWGGDNFIAVHENFMQSALRESYRMGDKETAENLRLRLDQLYGTGHSPPTPKYAKPLDILVQEQAYQEYEMQPHVATTDVQNALYYGLRLGLGRGKDEIYDDAKKFAKQVLDHFKHNRYNDFVNKFDEARIAGIIGDLENVEVAVFYRIMIDTSIPLDERLRIYHYYANDAIRVQVYDDIRPQIELQLARSALGAGNIDELLPEPPGMEDYRLSRARERLRQAEQGDTRAETERR